MIQLAQRAALHPLLFVSQVLSHPLAQPRPRFCQTEILEIVDHIQLRRGPRIARELTAQGEIAAVIEVHLLPR
jgi:hypothetical protein